MKTLSTPEKHQLKIARKTLNMSDASAFIAGGMSKDEARAFLQKIGHKIKEPWSPCYQLGRQAFRDGKSSIPCQDQDFLDTLIGVPVGGALPSLKEWTDGWHSEDLK